MPTCIARNEQTRSPNRSGCGGVDLRREPVPGVFLASRGAGNR